ncbi:MAG: S9 family peptidase, partial [Cyanobacteria bacterium J06641_5]
MTVAPYGSWRSPIAPKLLAAGTLRLGAAAWVENASGGKTRQIPCWLEGRPAEKGRTTLVARTADGQNRELIPTPANVRSRVHEYGGGAFCCVSETIYFSDGADNRIYRQPPGSELEALTPAGKECRYADLIGDPVRDRLLCVRELQPADATEPINDLVSIDLASGAVEILTTGSNFYAAPRPSPDSQQLAWLDWQHPNMPWDGTQLWVAAIAPDGTLQAPVCVAGSATESIHHPRWSPADGKLYFASDRSGWWNLYCWDGRDVTCVLAMAAEFAYPHWVFGLSTYDFWGRDRLVCTYSQGGCWHLGTIDLNTSALTS